MNFNQIAMLQKLKSSMDRFRNNHPKFPLFLKAVVGNALEEGTLVEMYEFKIKTGRSGVFPDIE